jgi:beta-lactamase regulating signal transducer with metallopeptidase domain
MGGFLLYIVESAVYLIVLYIFIKAFLSGDTFFKFNRLIILIGVIICFIIPLIELSITIQPSAIQIPVRMLENAFEVRETALSETTILSENFQKEIIPQEEMFSFSYILLSIYLIGGLINFILLCKSIYAMNKLIKNGEKKEYKGYAIVITQKNINPFSWHKYIVISKKDYEENANEILMHEMAHIQHRHSFDLILAECLVLFQWFNPAIWLLKKELKDIHEYQADMNVLQSGIDATKYQLLLVKKAVGTSSYTLANSFNHSKIKKRITMMLKEKSNKWAKLKLVLLFPAITICMYAFAQPAVSNLITTVSIGENTNILPKERKSEGQVFQDSKETLEKKNRNASKRNEDPNKVMEAKVQKAMAKVQEMSAELHKEIEGIMKEREVIIKKLNADLQKEMEIKMKDPDADIQKEMEAKVEIIEAKIQEMEAELQKEIAIRTQALDAKVKEVEAELEKEMEALFSQANKNKQTPPPPPPLPRD